MLVQLAHLLEKAIKTNVFLTNLKLHCRSPSITFFPFGSQKCPSRTPFGQHRAPSWAPWPPLEILKGHDRRTQRDRNFQKACHTSSICPKRALRANMKKLNCTQEKKHFLTSSVPTCSRSIGGMAFGAFFLFFCFAPST